MNYDEKQYILQLFFDHSLSVEDICESLHLQEEVVRKIIDSSERAAEGESEELRKMKIREYEGVLEEIAADPETSGSARVAAATFLINELKGRNDSKNINGAEKLIAGAGVAHFIKAFKANEKHKERYLKKHEEVVDV